MKGLLISEFLEMVEKDYGYSMVNELMESEAIPPDRLYISGFTYPPKEILDMFSNLSTKRSIDPISLMNLYSTYLMKRSSAYKDRFLGEEHLSFYTYLCELDNLVRIHFNQN